MDVDMESCITAEELLEKTFGRSNYIHLDDVKNVLSNDVFMSDMMATYNGKTFLHIAAQASDVSVLPTVVQAYRKASLLAKALSTRTIIKGVEGRDGGDGRNPLHIAIILGSYENTVLLLKECQEHCPDALTATVNGSTLLHLAVSRPEGVSIVKYLFREYREVCFPMLLVKSGLRGETPLQAASGTKFGAEHALSTAKTFAENVVGKNMPLMMQNNIREQHTQRQRKALDQAKELISILQEQTMEARAAEAERQAQERELKLFCVKELRINMECENLLQSEKWDALMKDYILSTDEDVQKIALNFLACAVSDTEVDVALPPLAAEVLNLLKKYLEGPEDDPVLKSSLKLLVEFSDDKDNNSVFFTQSESEEASVLSLVLKHLRSLQTDLQHLCVSVLLHLTTHREDSCPDEWIQPLLLAKSFSVDPEVKKVASEVVERLGASSEVPDPGTWDTGDVCFWMESNSSIEKRSEFARAFRDAEINGLHLLELSSTEMTALGVKFVSDQRNLSGLIDELRRLNMRSIVGRKDVFLSYAHINIQFAKKIKGVLNENNYTVWIDTAGIRAGQKWRTEIAHGIHDCQLFLFVMTPRSTNSQYCHDELSLAEEYKKPIITVRYQQAEEMDPGLKLTIQRRQWIDFIDAAQFTESCSKLLEAVHILIGEGSGPERDDLEQEQEQEIEHAVESAAGGVETEAMSASAMREMVAGEVERVCRELMDTVHSLEAQVTELTARLTALENKS